MMVLLIPFGNCSQDGLSACWGCAEPSQMASCVCLNHPLGAELVSSSLQTGRLRLEEVETGPGVQPPGHVGPLLLRANLLLQAFLFLRSLSPVPTSPDVFSESRLLLPDSGCHVMWSC